MSKEIYYNKKKEEVLYKLAELLNAHPDIADRIKEIIEVLLSPPWIKVEDELPYVYADMKDRWLGVTEQVLTRRENNSYAIDNMQYGKNGWFWVNASFDNAEVTHWMFIPTIIDGSSMAEIPSEGDSRDGFLSPENLQFGDKYKIPDGYAVFLKEDSDGYHFIVQSDYLDDCKIMVYDSFGCTYPDPHHEFMLICKA